MQCTGDTIAFAGAISMMLELLRVHIRGVVGSAARRAGTRVGIRTLAFLGICVVLVGVGIPLLAGPSSASADLNPVTVFLRIEGPAERSTFSQTGEYFTIWSGDVEVPREVTITAANGRRYRLFVEGGRYKSTRLDNGETRDLGPADDALGVPSVLAALHVASQIGDFSYQVTDSFYPGQGFFVTSIGGQQGSGAVGWSYRVWNDEVAASPQVSVERFLLGYDSMGVALPHTQVLFYWGYATRCLPLRVAPTEGSAQCGLPASVRVQSFVESAGGGGYWSPVAGARVWVGDEWHVTGDDGIAELVFAQSGTHLLDASAGYDGSYYYVPADGRASIDVSGPCVVISFTVVDRGDPGITFGYVVPGTTGQPELGQTDEIGAVTLIVGAETSIDCVVQLKAGGGLTGVGVVMPLSGITWGLDSGGTDAAAMPVVYADVGDAPAWTETTYDVWHWLSVPSDQPLGAYAGKFYYRVMGAEP